MRPVYMISGGVSKFTMDNLLLWQWGIFKRNTPSLCLLCSRLW